MAGVACIARCRLRTGLMVGAWLVCTPICVWNFGNWLSIGLPELIESTRGPVTNGIDKGPVGGSTHSDKQV